MRIMSIDGGGVRGYVALLMIWELERQLRMLYQISLLNDESGDYWMFGDEDGYSLNVPLVAQVDTKSDCSG